MRIRDRHRGFKIFICILLVFIILIIAGAITFATLWSSEIKTMSSLTTLSEGDGQNTKPVYYLDYTGGFYFDDFVEQGGADTAEGVANFLADKLTRGFYKPDFVKNESKLGCSTFTAQTKDGKRLLGRNYDFSAAPICIVKTDPGRGRHKSYSCVDVSKIVKGVDNPELQKLLLLASPYACMDGINDAGFSCSMLLSYQGAKPGDHESTGIGTDFSNHRFSCIDTVFIRYMLDFASSVDDAVNIAERIDLHELPDAPCHFMVADANGKSAIIEWIGDKATTDTDGSRRQLHVQYQNTGQNYQVASNFIAKPGYYENAIPYGFDRYKCVDSQLTSTNGLIDNSDSAMDILKSVARKTNGSKFQGSFDDLTLWSCVYNLTDKSITLVDNEYYDKALHKFEFKF